MDYNKLIQRVIRDFFSEIKLTSIGKLEWYPPTEKEIKKTFDKSGIKVSQQRYQCFKTDEFEINSIYSVFLEYYGGIIHVFFWSDNS